MGTLGLLESDPDPRLLRVVPYYVPCPQRDGVLTYALQKRRGALPFIRCCHPLEFSLVRRYAYLRFAGRRAWRRPFRGWSSWRYEVHKWI